MNRAKNTVQYLLALLIFVWLSQGSAALAFSADQLQEGDLIFQKTGGRQARALLLATGSPYSHVGIAFKNNNQWWVYEAIGPVKSTPLHRFLRRGGGHGVVKRLKDHNLLTPAKVHYAKTSAAGKYTGKPYDFTFEWSDSRIYCSELAYKLYYDTLGIKLVQLERLGDFDLSHPFVKKILQERYGSNVPLNEKVISVIGLMKSPRLKTAGVFTGNN